MLWETLKNTYFSIYFYFSKLPLIWIQHVQILKNLTWLKSIFRFLFSVGVLIQPKENGTWKMNLNQVRNLDCRFWFYVHESFLSSSIMYCVSTATRNLVHSQYKNIVCIVVQYSSRPQETVHRMNSTKYHPFAQ